MATKFITVSIEIMHDTNLNQSQKFILAEIEQLSQLDRGCIASNSHFSELIGITKENVSRNINDLEKKGYITIEIVNGSRNHTRIIRVTKIVRPPYQNSKTPLSKQQETKGIEQSNKTNNIAYPTLEEVKEYILEKNYKVDANYFFEFFNNSNWIDSKGNKVKNWKQKLITWNNHSKVKSYQNVTTRKKDEDILF